MLEDFVLENLDSFDDIDTSDLDHLDSTSEDYSDFYETFTASDSFETDDLENYDGISLENNPFNEDEGEINHKELYEHEHSSQISFGLGCHCMVHGCGCRSFEGTFGCVCTNCHHGYDKHY